VKRTLHNFFKYVLVPGFSLDYRLSRVKRLCLTNLFNIVLLFKLSSEQSRVCIVKRFPHKKRLVSAIPTFWKSRLTSHITDETGPACSALPVHFTRLLLLFLSVYTCTYFVTYTYTYAIKVLAIYTYIHLLHRVIIWMHQNVDILPPHKK